VKLSDPMSNEALIPLVRIKCPRWG